jgi:hypothetical protein
MNPSAAFLLAVWVQSLIKVRDSASGEISVAIFHLHQIVLLSTFE